MPSVLPFRAPVGAKPQAALSVIGPYAIALGLVILSAVVCEALFRLLGTSRLSMVFLVGVLLTAVTQGAYPAYFAAIAAFVVYNFFLSDPRFTFSFNSPEDIIILVVFLTAAVLTGGLAGRLRDEATRSTARAQATGALFRASRELSETGEEKDLRDQLVWHVASAVGGEAVLTAGDATWRASANFDGSTGESDWRRLPVRAGEHELGELNWRPGPNRPITAEEDRLIAVLVDLGAAAIARARLGAAKAEVEAITRTEQLRNALLSSISHDLRTPLSAILVSASSLYDYGDRFQPNVRKDLLQTVQEEARRLSRYVENLLNIGRLEAGVLPIGETPIDLADVVREVAVLHERRAGANRITTQLDADSLTVKGDQVLMEQALGNVVENALRFSPDASPVEIRAFRRGGSVIVEVLDQGDGVPGDELERIFDKFYRSRTNAAHLQGSGLGLSISKGLVEAMGGAIRASARPDLATGLAVSISFTGAAQ